MHPSQRPATGQQKRVSHYASNADAYALFNLLTGPQLLDRVEELLPEHREWRRRSWRRKSGLDFCILLSPNYAAHSRLGRPGGTSHPQTRCTKVLPLLKPK